MATATTASMAATAADADAAAAVNPSTRHKCPAAATVNGRSVDRQTPPVSRCQCVGRTWRMINVSATSLMLLNTHK